MPTKGHLNSSSSIKDSFHNYLPSRKGSLLKHASHEGWASMSTEKALREESSDSPRQICTSRNTKYSKILSHGDVSQGMISQQTHIKIDR